MATLSGRIFSDGDLSPLENAFHTTKHNLISYSKTLSSQAVKTPVSGNIFPVAQTRKSVLSISQTSGQSSEKTTSSFNINAPGIISSVSAIIGVTSVRPVKTPVTLTPGNLNEHIRNYYLERIRLALGSNTTAYDEIKKQGHAFTVSDGYFIGKHSDSGLVGQSIPAVHSGEGNISQYSHLALENPSSLVKITGNGLPGPFFVETDTGHSVNTQADYLSLVQTQGIPVGLSSVEYMGYRAMENISVTVGTVKVTSITGGALLHVHLNSQTSSTKDVIHAANNTHKPLKSYVPTPGSHYEDAAGINQARPMNLSHSYVHAEGISSTPPDKEVCVELPFLTNSTNSGIDLSTSKTQVSIEIDKSSIVDLFSFIPMSFAPIHVTKFKKTMEINGSDFTRGINESNVLLGGIPPTSYTVVSGGFTTFKLMITNFEFSSIHKNAAFYENENTVVYTYNTTTMAVTNDRVVFDPRTHVGHVCSIFIHAYHPENDSLQNENRKFDWWSSIKILRVVGCGSVVPYSNIVIPALKWDPRGCKPFKGAECSASSTRIACIDSAAASPGLSLGEPGGSSSSMDDTGGIIMNFANGRRLAEDGPPIGAIPAQHRLSLSVNISDCHNKERCSIGATNACGRSTLITATVQQASVYSPLNGNFISQ